MLVLQPYALQDPQGAVEFLLQIMDGRERLFAQMAAASKEMHLTHNPSRFLFVRFGLMEYAAAAYATKNRATFDAAVESLMANPLPKDGPGFKPTLAQRGGDLAVALSCRRNERLPEIAGQILGTPSGTTPEDVQAHILALMARNQCDKASEMLPRMREAIAASTLSRHEIALMSAWTDVAESVAVRNSSSLGPGLQKSTQLRTAYVSRMLARWRNGQNTELTALDFWDSHTTALTAMAAKIGMRKGLVSAGPFADLHWTTGAHEPGAELPGTTSDDICGLAMDEGRR